MDGILDILNHSPPWGLTPWKTTWSFEDPAIAFFLCSAEKLFTSLLIVCKERSSIHIYSVYFTVYLLWESPWIAYRVSILYNNHAVMIDHPLRVKILWLSTINMLKVTMIWEHQQQWISRAIVIFFMQCGFAFLEAGSVRSASTSSSHHCQCFLVHIYKYISHKTTKVLYVLIYTVVEIFQAISSFT